MEISLEMERLYMEREDRLSKEYNEFCHRQLFKQKDANPPMLPVCMHFENPFINIPVQLNLPPTPT